MTDSKIRAITIVKTFAGHQILENIAVKTIADRFESLDAPDPKQEGRRLLLSKTILVVGALAAATFVSSVETSAAAQSRHGRTAAPMRHLSYRSRGRTERWAAARGVRGRAMRPSAATPTPSAEHYAYLPSDAYPQSATATGAPSRVAAATPRPLPRRSRVAAAPAPVLATRRLAPVAAAAAGGGQVGGASFYSGGRTASGGIVGAATCAHRTLPFGTKVLVTNLANAHQAVLTVNDRGPFVRGRIIDVSSSAASALGMRGSGTAEVRVQVVGGPG